MFCTICGTELPEDANFCLKCGRPQREGIAPPTDGGKSRARKEHCRITYFEKKTLPGVRHQLYAEGTDAEGKDYVIAQSDFLIAPFNQGPRLQAIRNLVQKLEAEGWELTSIPTNEKDYVGYRFQRRVQD
ncbi:MAG: zinc ribbon domain-containing protein [bacterium]